MGISSVGRRRCRLLATQLTVVLLPLVMAVPFVPRAASAAVSAYDSVVLADGPVAYLGGASDLTGNGHDGTFTGTPGTATLPNGETAEDYDGVGQYLTLADAPEFSATHTGAITIEAWMRPDTLQFPHSEGSGYVHWLGKGTPGQHEYVARMYSLTNSENRPNRVSGYAFNPAGGLGAGGFFQDGMTAGQWLHYTLVINTNVTSVDYPTGYTKVYRDGQLRDQDRLADYSVVPADGTAPLRIATRDLGSFFDGAIGKVAVYNRELTAGELVHHVHTMTPPTPPPATVSGTATHVGALPTAASATAATTLTTVVPAAGVPAGNTLIARVVTSYAPAAPSVSVPRGNTCVLGRTGPDGAATMRVSLLSCRITTALQAGDVITLTTASLARRSLAVDEFSGLLSPTTVDVHSGRAGSSSAPRLDLPLNTTNRNDLVVAGVGTMLGTTESYTSDPSGAWSPLANVRTSSGEAGQSDVVSFGGFRSVGQTGAFNFTPTLTASARWVELMVAYRGTPPSRPSGVSAVAHVGSATVSWTGPASWGGSEPDHYTITASPGGTVTRIAAPDTTTGVVSNLTAGTPYTFTVTAHSVADDSAASDPSGPVTPTADVPTAPGPVTATAADGQVHLQWNAPSSDGGSGLLGYTVTVSPGGTVAVDDPTATGTTVTGLTNDTVYSFSVAARNTHGTGPFSAPVDATPAIPTYTLQVPADPIEESAGAVQITATLSATSSHDVVIPVSTVAGTATPGQDYTALSGGTTISIPAGSPSGSIAVTIIDDVVDEAGPQHFQVVGAAGTNIAGTDAVTIGIADNDLPPTFAMADVSHPEGYGPWPATFTVHLSNPSSEAIDFVVGHTAGTAVDTTTTRGSNDYDPPAPTLSIPAGSLTGTVTVPVNGDGIVEPDESATITVQRAPGETDAAGPQDTATLTLTNDDAAPTITAPSYRRGTGPVTISGTVRAGAQVQLFTAPIGRGALASAAFTTADGNGHYAFKRYLSAGHVIAVKADDVPSTTKLVRVAQRPHVTGLGSTSGVTTIQVTANPRASGLPVKIQRLHSNRTWITVATGTTGNNGIHTRTVPGPRPGTTAHYRAYVAGNPLVGTLGGHSTAIRIAHP